MNGWFERAGRRIEGRVRRAWRERSGPGLRACGALFAVAADARFFLYELGIFERRRPPVPVISVGGLTVGGSGKTPVVASLSGWLRAAGRRPAVLTRGYADELELHRSLLAGTPVLGHRDPLLASREAARRGADCAVLDDGFAHRRLERRLDVLLVDVDALARTNGRRLPAGPFRHPAGALAFADVIVVTRRCGRAASHGPRAEMAARVADRLARAPQAPLVGRVALRAGRLLPANRSAGSVASPDPAVALAGIMKPRLFFEQVRERWPRLVRVHSFRDHGAPGPDRLEAVVRDAGRRGIVCTLKDAVRLGARIGESTPLWYVEELIEWEAGASRIRERSVRVARPFP